MKSSINRIVKELYILILGMFGFSMLGQYVMLNVLHFPFLLMELYYIPLLYHYRKTISAYLWDGVRRMTKMQILLLALILVSMLMSVVNTSGLSMLLEYRSIIYLFFIFFFVCKRGVNPPIKLVLKLSFYAVMSELLFVVFINDSDITSSVNCMALAASIIAAFFCEKYLLGIVAFVMSVGLGIVSGFRIGIVIAAVALLEALAFTMIRRDKNKLSVSVKRIAVVGAFLGVMVILLAYYEPIIMFVAKVAGMSQFAIFRVTERLGALLRLDFETSQDSLRLEIFRYPIERFVSSIVPRGLIGSAVGEYWLYIDVPILYLYDIFGSFGAYGIVGYLIGTILRKVRLIFKRTDGGYEKSANGFQTLAVLLSPIMLCLLIINGTFMVSMFQAIQTAVILGGLCQKKRSNQLQ